VAVLVVGKPHLVQPYEAIIEALGTLQATAAIPLIEPFLQHFVEKVRYAAARPSINSQLTPTMAIF
jgi:phycocyanobilin lyase alpha subunit